VKAHLAESREAHLYFKSGFLLSELP
jgi:hypothetical protein